MANNDIMFDPILGELREKDIFGGTGGTAYEAGPGIDAVALEDGVIAVSGLTATVSGTTATITPKGSTVGVKFVGAGGTTVSEGEDGEVEIESDAYAFSDDFDVFATGDEPPANVTFVPNRFFGKTLVCCGDSITYGSYLELEPAAIASSTDIDVYQRSGTSWNKLTTDIRKTFGYQIANRNHMTFYCDGISGSTMTDNRQSGAFSRANGRYANLPENIDYLVIMFGVNDAGQDLSLGTISDNVNTTFYGAWNIVMTSLLSRYPTTKIGLIVPMAGDADFREAVRLIGNKYGVGVFDMFQAGTPLFYLKEDSVGVNASVVTANHNTYFAQLMHPNLAGHTLLGGMVENWLNSL